MSLGEDFQSIADHRELTLAGLFGAGFAKRRLIGWVGIGPAISRQEESLRSFGPTDGGMIVDFQPGWNPDSWQFGAQAAARLGIALTAQIGVAAGTSGTLLGGRTVHSSWLALEIGRLMLNNQ